MLSSVGNEHGEGAKSDSVDISRGGSTAGLFGFHHLLGLVHFSLGLLLLVLGLNLLGFLGLLLLGFLVVLDRRLRSSSSIQVSLDLSLSLLVGLAIVSFRHLLLIGRLAHDAVLFVHEPGVADTALVVIPVIERVRRGEGDQVTRVSLDTLGEVLGVRGISLLGEGAHFGAA